MQLVTPCRLSSSAREAGQHLQLPTNSRNRHQPQQPRPQRARDSTIQPRTSRRYSRQPESITCHRYRLNCHRRRHWTTESAYAKVAGIRENDKILQKQRDSVAVDCSVGCICRLEGWGLWCCLSVLRSLSAGCVWLWVPCRGCLSGLYVSAGLRLFVAAYMLFVKTCSSHQAPTPAGKPVPTPQHPRDTPNVSTLRQECLIFMQTSRFGVVLVEGYGWSVCLRTVRGPGCLRGCLSRLYVSAMAVSAGLCCCLGCLRGLRVSMAAGPRVAKACARAVTVASVSAACLCAGLLRLSRPRCGAGCGGSAAVFWCLRL
jgi:hypothetical protein